MKRNIILIMFLLGVMSCDITQTCPIVYQVETDTTYTLIGSWRMIGFLPSGSNSIEYPPCQGNNTFPAVPSISFNDTSYCQPDTLSNYPFCWGAHLVNWCGGLYYSNYIDTLMISGGGGIGCTEMYGPEEYMDYEHKLMTTLPLATRYEINHNILTIFYSNNERMLFVRQN